MGDNRDSRRDSHEGMRWGQVNGQMARKFLWRMAAYGGWLYLYLGGMLNIKYFYVIHTTDPRCRCGQAAHHMTHTALRRFAAPEWTSHLMSEQERPFSKSFCNTPPLFCRVVKNLYPGAPPAIAHPGSLFQSGLLGTSGESLVIRPRRGAQLIHKHACTQESDRRKERYRRRAAG